MQEEIRKVKEELSGLTEGSGESGLVIQGKEEEIARIEKEMKDGEQLLETLKEEILSLSQEKRGDGQTAEGIF